MSPRPRAHLRREGTTPAERRERIEAGLRRRTAHDALFGALVFLAAGGTLYWVRYGHHEHPIKHGFLLFLVPVLVLFALYEPYSWLMQRLTSSGAVDVVEPSAPARRRPPRALGRGRVAGAVLCVCLVAFLFEVWHAPEHALDLLALSFSLPMLVFLLYRPVCALLARRSGHDA